MAFKHSVNPEYNILRSQNKLENVILAAYKRYGLSYAEIGSSILIDGSPVGRILPPDETGASGGIEILKDLTRGNLVLLKKGTIFDAPYCEVEINWTRKLPLFQRLAMMGRRVAAQRNYLEAVAAKEKALRLSEELDEKNRDLEELVQSLEQKVEDRTADLNSTLNRLKELDVLKSNLLATLSHELRTPLALIKAPLDRTLRGERGQSIPADDPALKDMSRQVDRLIGTLDGILDFAMLELDRLTLTLRPYAIEKLVGEIAADWSGAFEEAGLSLRSAPHPEQPVVVECVPQLIRTAIANLISNAVKYTPRGGTATVGLRTDGASAEIFVEDSGVGIQEPEQARIFDRFYRSAEAVGRGIPGRGLGLSLTRSIAELPDPVSAPAEVFIRGRRGGTERPSGKASVRRARLLYVEDNRELAELVRSGLEQSHSVELASDAMMPGMDGVELMRRANRSKDGKVPFLFLTAKADEQSRMDALDEGALDYIKKPFDEIELRRKIDNLIAFKDGLAAWPDSRPPGAGQEARTALLADGLTEREAEVALLLGRGCSRKEIAEELCIALATAKRRVENIYRKLGVQDRFQLFADYMGTST